MKLLFSSYALGCVWYWYVKMTDNVEYSNYPPGSGNFIDDAIAIKVNGGTETVETKREMLVTMYFMLTTLTTVGYGDDLTPKNVNEYMLMVWIMLIGVTFFAWSVDQIKDRTNDIL